MNSASTLPEKYIHNVLRNAKSGNFTPLKTILSNYKSKTDFYKLVYKVSGDCILHVAAAQGTAADILFILRYFNDPLLVNYRNKDGKTPLHEACQCSQRDNVKVLLEEGADVNVIKRADWTPLMLACAKTQGSESVEIVKMLLEKKALVNLVNKDGWNALHLVSRDGNLGVFRLLIANGANPDAVTNNSRTVLHIAALHGNIDIVKEILQLQKLENIDVIDKCGNTPLHEAVLGGHKAIYQFLIDHKSDINRVNSVGYSVVHFAASVGSLEMLRYLVSEHNCDVNSIAKSGLTPLHCAARKGYKEAYELLVDLGANSDAKDHFARTANEYFPT